MLGEGEGVRRIVERLEGLGPLGIWITMVVSAEAVTFAAMTPLSHYFHGELTTDYVVTGAVACFVSGGLVSAGVVWALGVYRRMEGEQRELEDQLIEAHRHEAISHLAAGIAHDFNNLMVAVLGNASYLRSALPEPSEEVTEALRDIEEAGHSASGLVEQLQVYARGAGHEHEVVDLSEILHSVLQLLDHGLHPRTRVVREIEPGLVVVGNASRLRQAAMNLCINAADAMPDGGELRVSATRAEDTVRVEVTDQGPGIPSDVLGRIFEPFFTTRGDEGGTGMGLAVVHGVAGSHGGRVSATNRSEGGASFVLELPASDRPAPQRPPPLERPTREHSGRVLVVDDVPANRRLAGAMLTRLGFEAIEAESGECALEHLASEPVDLVLLDLRMPGLDGEEVLDELRERHGRELPVLVISGHADAETRARLAAAGAGFLGKPYHYEAFVAAIDQILGEPQ